MPEERRGQSENPPVAVVVSVPEEHFSDEDDICVKAGMYVCSRLEQHLLQEGHQIENWIQGGCPEDWGVYYESVLEGRKLQYTIVFFAAESGAEARSIMVQYNQKQSLLKKILGKPDELPIAHPLHATMKRFGTRFAAHRVLTKSQYEREY